MNEPLFEQEKELTLTNVTIIIVSNQLPFWIANVERKGANTILVSTFQEALIHINCRYIDLIIIEGDDAESTQLPEIETPIIYTSNQTDIGEQLMDVIDGDGSSVSTLKLNAMYRGNEQLTMAALNVIRTNFNNEITNFEGAIFEKNKAEIKFCAHRVRPITSLLGASDVEDSLFWIEENAHQDNDAQLIKEALNSIRNLKQIQREVMRLCTRF